MSSLIVISWIGMGFFAAYIANHLVKDRSRGSGIGNLAVCVLGALLGGLGAHALMRGYSAYHIFIVCAGAALLVSLLLLGITRFYPRRDGMRSRAY
jgi:uncharacterized membrane protein YeaQ/YmgE (transglycosylase-associated protein family)